MASRSRKRGLGKIVLPSAYLMKKDGRPPMAPSGSGQPTLRRSVGVALRGRGDLLGSTREIGGRRRKFIERVLQLRKTKSIEVRD